MSRNILCAVYLLIAISAVHSASYYYRAGREVIVPTIEEVREVISELKKDEGVIVEEIVAAVPSEPIEPVVKSVPVVESVGPVVEAVDANVVADAEKVVVADEARSKPNPVLRLDTLEVIQPAGEKSEKVVTVAETVKNAAVQAIERQNQEVAEEIKEPLVKSVPEPVVPVVEQVVPSVVEPVVPAVVENVEAVKSVEVVPVVESVMPVVEAVKESVRSADPEPAKPEEPAQEEKKPEVQQPTEKAVVAPENRQQTTGPLDQLSNTITSFANTIQHAVQNAIQNGQNVIQSAIRPPQQSDTPAAETPASELNAAAAAAAPAADATQAAAPTTAGPNLLQSVQQAITQFTNNIIPAQLRPTAAPAAHPETPVVVSGTRGGDETVEVVQNIDVDVNDKVDLEKKAQ